MKKIVFIGMLVAGVSATGIASADPLRLGFGMDLGVPSGAAVGFVVRPKLDWLSLQASLTHNVLNFGGRLSAKADPVELLAPNFPVGLFVDVQGGFAAQGTIPGHSDLPSLGYDYVNTYLGLRLGRMKNFHWNIEAGPSYMVFNTDNFQSVVSKNVGNGLTVGNPSVSGWVLPTVSTGFEVVWP